MTTFAHGSRHSVSYVEEATKGTTPGTPTMKELRITGDSLNLSKPGFQSNELRSDRQITDYRHGHYEVGGSLDFELSYGAFDDFLEGALFADWTSLATDIDTGFSVATSTPAADQLLDSNSGFLTLGLQAGDWITVSGFTADGNNGDFLVVSASAGTLSISPYAGLSTEAAGDPVTITRNPMLYAGTTQHSYTIERAFEGMDTDQYHQYTGCMLNMDLTFPTEGMVTGSFSVVGMGANAATSTSLGTPTAAATNSPYDSFIGALYENKSSISVVTNITMSIDNGLMVPFAIGSQAGVDVVDGRSNVTGTMSLYFQDSVMYNKFRNETESEFYVSLEDVPSGTTHGNKYIFRCPRIKYTNADLPVNDEGAVTISMPFQALRDATEGTNLIIAKIASD